MTAVKSSLCLVYENKEEVSSTYLTLHAAMVNLASTYTEEELELITGFLSKAGDVLDEQIEDLSSKIRGKSTS
ncbi:hypothetical protein MKY42_14385 [Paenibacillus sp. FSL W7-1088]|uniref:hypothetical protein n=1 Tax=Paenibacillus sp. FSL W7-1088 TaxID=2921695 RepID=UPI0030ECED01